MPLANTPSYEPQNATLGLEQPDNERIVEADSYSTLTTEDDLPLFTEANDYLFQEG